MAILRNVAIGGRFAIEADHVVGRSPRAALFIDQHYVSSQHASIRWNGERWEVKDLGSTNGTFVDHKRIQPGVQHPISKGVSLCFGHPSQEWVLDDDTPPSVMVVPQSGGEPIVADGELVAVPSSDDPLVAIYRGPEGRWLLERPDEALSAIEDQSTFEVAGKTWRFCCPNVVVRTSVAAEQHELRMAKLRFMVSRDEEHVALTASIGGEAVDLGARTHHYLLLTLARMRLRDAAQGVPDTACGWVYQDELIQGLDATAMQLNLDVHRIRRQFGSLDVYDPATIIERRPRARQLRIGVADLVIEVL